MMGIQKICHGDGWWWVISVIYIYIERYRSLVIRGSIIGVF